MAKAYGEYWSGQEEAGRQGIEGPIIPQGRAVPYEVADTYAMPDRDPSLSQQVGDLRGRVGYLTEQLEKLSAAFNELNCYVR